MKRPRRQAGQAKKGGNDREELPGAVGAVVESHAHLVELAVPFSDARDREVFEVADEGVSEDLPSTHGDARLLYRVVDVADEADAVVADDIDRLDRRQLLVRQHADVGGHKVQGCPDVEVAGVVGHDRPGHGLIVVVKEEGHRELDQRRRQKRAEPGHQVGVGDSQFGLGQLHGGAAVVCRPRREPRRRGPRHGRGAPACAPAAKRSAWAFALRVFLLGGLAVASFDSSLLLGLASPLDNLGLLVNLLLLPRILSSLISRPERVRLPRGLVGLLRHAAEPPCEPDQDPVLPRHWALVRGVNPSTHVDVYDGLLVLHPRPLVAPVVLLAEVGLPALALDVGRWLPIVVSELADMPGGVRGEQDHLLVAFADDGNVGEGARDGHLVGRVIDVYYATYPRVVVLVADLGCSGHAGLVDTLGKARELLAPGAGLPVGILAGVAATTIAVAVAVSVAARTTARLRHVAASGLVTRVYSRLAGHIPPPALGLAVLVMPLPRGPGLRPKEQAAAVLCSSADVVDPAGLGEPTLLASEDVAVDARLQAVLVVREGVEAEVEQALTVSLARGVREEVSQQALPGVRMGLAEQASEGPKGSHFARLSALQPRRGGGYGSAGGCLCSVRYAPRMLLG